VQGSLLAAEGARAKEFDEYEAKCRIEIDVAHRRLELLQANLEEAKAEIAVLKERIGDLEAEAVDRQTCFFEGKAVVPAAETSRRPGGTSSSTAFEIAMLGAGHVDLDTSLPPAPPPLRATASSTSGPSSSSPFSAEEHRAELEHVRSLLKERTAQLRIVMETLDAVQAEGVRPGSARAAGTSDFLSGAYGVGDVEGAQALFGLAGVGGGPTGAGVHAMVSAVDGPWGVKALVKRVVELTADLTSQSAALAMEERRAAQLEREALHKTRDIAQLRTNARAAEDALARMKLSAEALGSQLRDAEQRRQEDVAAIRGDNERLAAALRDAENEVASLHVTVEELTRQMELAEQVDQRQWLESVIMKDAETCAKHVDMREQQKQAVARNAEEPRGGSSKAPSSDRVDLRSLIPLLAPMKENVAADATGSHLSVRDLLISLLVQWREHAGPLAFVRASAHPPKDGRDGTGARAPSMTKAEQRFFQRVCDLVTAANQRCSQALHDSHRADCQRTKAELALKVTQDRLRSAAQQLQRYRKRAYACEKVARSDRKHAERKETKLVSLLTRSLNEQRAKATAATGELFAARKEMQARDISRAAELLELRRLQVRVAELEARGGPSLRGRDEAVRGLEERVRATEQSLQTWFAAELPRLLSGLPLKEEAMATFFDSAGLDRRSPAAGFSSDFVFASGGGQAPFPVSAQLGAAMGMDRSYALARTLCTSQAALAARDVQITGLLEKNYILKERNVELEMVLRRWQADVDATAALLADLSGMPGGRHADMKASRPLSSSHPVGLDKAERLAAHADEWQRRSLEMEGAGIEAKAKLERANARLAEMAHLVDVLTSEGDNLKGESTRQLTRVRTEMENAHTAELRSLRAGYEDDKRSLMEQLDALASVVETARLASVADALSREGKQGSYKKLVHAMRAIVDARDGGQRRRHEQSAYGAAGTHEARSVATENRQTQTAFLHAERDAVRPLQEKLAKLTAELDAERGRHSAARSEVSRWP